MDLGDVVLLGLIGGGGYYLYQRSKTAPGAAGGDFQFTLNGGGGNNNNRGPNVRDAGINAGVALAGQTLTALTGIPGFSQLGQAIAGLFGQGRRQADDLVQHYQNPLLDDAKQLIDQWIVALNTGKATFEVKETLKQLLIQMVEQFREVASQPQFNKAGPGGIKTVENVLYNVWLPNIEEQYNRLGVE